MSILSIFLLIFSVIVPSYKMVKQGDFKTCQQSTFCVRHRSFVELKDAGEAPSPWNWKSESATFAPNSISAFLNSDDFQETLRAEFTILQNNTVRFKLVEKDPFYPRYEFPFGLESDPTCVPYSKKVDASGKVIVTFDEKNILEITPSPFSFILFYDSNPAISFNSRGFLYYETYKKEQTTPRFAVVNEELSQEVKKDVTDSETKINDLKKKMAQGLTSDEFNGKTDTKPRGAASIGFDLSFPGSDHVFGIPEHATSFSLKATRGEGAPYSEPYRLYNLDVFEYILDSPMALYGAVPFMLSHKVGQSAGVLWLNSAEMWVDVEKKKGGISTHWMSESGLVDLFLFLGPTQSEIFNSYTKLTGRPQLPQKFATAYHQCRWNYNTEQDALDVDSKFDENTIPYDVLWLDIEHTDGKRYFTWDYQKFPNPEQMQKTLAAKGRKMVTIIDPHIKKDSGYYISQKANELDLFVKDKDGNVYDGWCWPGDSNWLDYSNPKARDYWANQFQYANYKDSTPSLYTWNDMNEPAIFTGPEATMPKDCLHYGNIEHRDIHNAYGMLQHRSTFEGHLKRSGNQDRPFILSRAFFIGTQRYGAIWTGDNTADWGHLANSVPMLLSISIAGITFAGADVGGFFNNPDAELMVRWYQVGSLQPFFRAHAHIETKRREPWLFGEPYTTLFREAVERRYRLLPYIYTLFHESHETGSPVMRSMMQEFPSDTLTFDMDDQFMLGMAILVKPVTKAGQDSVSVYLPPSAKWYHYDSFESVSGDPFFSLDTKSLSVVPIFYRGGQIVPRKDRIRRSSLLTERDPFSLYVALDEKKHAKGCIYIDDGSSYAYKNGVYVNSVLSFADSKLTFEPLSLSDYPIDESSERPFNSRIERIVLIGMSSEPERITYLGKDLVFVTRKTGREFAVTIKNPNMLIGDSVEIEIL